MKTLLNRIFTVFMALSLIVSTSYGASPFLSSDYLGKSAGHDFISGAQRGDVLIKVNLWGAVHRPGIHRIPSKTDLLTLMSYAGGPTGDALLDEVTIKRNTGKSRKLIKVDLGELVQGSSHHHIELAPDDVIVIPADKPLISQDTLAIAGVTSLVLSAILTVILIDRNADRN